MKTFESIINLIPLALTLSIIWFWIASHLLIKEGREVYPNKVLISLLITFGILPPAIIISSLLIYFFTNFLI